MIEIPRACWVADEIAEHAQFFSFGTNDLTQMTFGYSRDDAEGGFLLKYVEEKILPYNPFQSLDPVIVKEMDMAVKLGRKHSPRPQGGHLRRARRRPDVDRVLPPDRPQLRLLLAVPGAGGSPRGGPGGPGGGGGARQVTVPRQKLERPAVPPPGVPLLSPSAAGRARPAASRTRRSR